MKLFLYNFIWMSLKEVHCVPGTKSLHEALLAGMVVVPKDHGYDACQCVLSARLNDKPPFSCLFFHIFFFSPHISQWKERWEGMELARHVYDVWKVYVHNKILILRSKVGDTPPTDR